MSEEKLKDIFIDRLNHYLQLREKTQADLAKYLNVSATTINNWSKGYNLPRMDKIDDICQFLNVRRSQLLGETEYDEKTEIETIAAHATGDLTDEEIEEVIRYAKYLKSQRGNK